MFYAPIGRFIPNSFNSNTSTQYAFPRQLAMHFLKKDATTGETREVGINDDLIMIRLKEDVDDWTYVNLKDVLFFCKSNDAQYFSRDKNKFFAYYGNTDPSYYWSKTNSIPTVPHCIHISHEGKDYIVPAKRLNTKDLSLTQIWGFDGDATTLRNKINELCTKYGLTNLGGYFGFYQFPDKSGFALGEYYIGWRELRTPIVIVDGKTPFPDCYFSSYSDYTTYMKNNYGVSAADMKPNSYSVTDSPTLLGAVPELYHKDYFPYDESQKLGTDITGKFGLYPKSYIASLPSQAIILEPINNIGLIVRAQNNNNNQFTLFSNVCEIREANIFDGFKEFDLVFYYGERSIKRRFNKRIRWGRSGQAGSQAIDGAYNPTDLFIESTATNLINVHGYAIDSYAMYPLILMKDADIYRTPKNQDYDYYGTFNEVPIDLHKDTSGSGTEYTWKNGVTNIVALQKGFTGKTTMSNPDEYKAATADVVFTNGMYNMVVSDDITSRGFRDWEMDFAIRQYPVLENSAPTKTAAPFKYSDWNIAGYTEADGLAAAADDILVDAQFDYFNMIYQNAPIYIVDTKILKTLGLSSPRYYRFMPNRCIWFEVNDLYEYDDAGKIIGYNTIYATTNGTFTYAPASFNWFKAKYYENVVVVQYDTQKDVMEDFNYVLDATTNLPLDPVLQTCDDVSEFHIVMWKPLQKAILRIGNITLNTEVAK